MKTTGFLCLLSCLFLQSAYSQQAKTYQTKEINSTITIDGVINEKVWEEVSWAGDFIQTEPENGAQPTFNTQFKILYDQTNLYVAIKAFDKQADRIVVSHMPRDFFDGDYVEINIDSDFDRKDAFSFTVTAAGIRGDEHILTSDNWFNDWNPSWTTKTSIDQEGWTAELEIPLTELEIYEKKEKWGIQVNRSLERLDEGSSWTSIPDEDKWVESFGLLEGIENTPIGKRFTYQEEILHELLQEDFKALYHSLKISYPSLYRYRSEEYMNHFYTQTLANLQEGNTLRDFYKIISSFISKIGDGHMKVAFPTYFFESEYENKKRFPFKVTFLKEEAFIAENYSGNDLLSHARILSIEGESIQSLTSKIAEFIPSDGYNVTGKYHKMADNFSFYYSLVSDTSDSINIDFVPEGQTNVQSASVGLIPESTIRQIMVDKHLSPSETTFDYKRKGDVGVMTLSTFNYPDSFMPFVDESFKEIAEANLKKLILDLRGNGGGEESNAIHLYSYLTTGPFLYYDRYEVNAPPQKTIDQESTLISYETLNFFSSISAIDGENRCILSKLEPLGDQFLDPKQLISPKSENHFDGEVVVLIDGGSFSATSEVCAIMQRDKRATFIGGETGGGFDGNTSGIYDQITLPNSRLTIKVPLVKYVSAVEEADFLYGRGVIPDFSVNAYGKTSRDQMMDFALKYLRR
ncbi:MAG: S41 family peptidase [Bacteroidota bacterium]